MKTPRSTRTKSTTLPVKPVMEELVFIRGVFRELIATYSTGIEAMLGELIGKVTALAREENPPRERVAEMRDMLILLRSLDVKPAKGRRRDLKKMESAIEDLRDLCAKW